MELSLCIHVSPSEVSSDQVEIVYVYMLKLVKLAGTFKEQLLPATKTVRYTSCYLVLLYFLDSGQLANMREQLSAVTTLCEAQKIVSWLGEKEHLFKK